MEQSPNLNMNDLAEKQQPQDYDYYDAQPGQRYMQAMRRNWNANNRGIRSDDFQSNFRFEEISQMSFNLFNFL